MILLAGVVLAAPTFAPPVPWGLGFAPDGRTPYAGDVNGDGKADMICVSPAGDTFIDVALTGDGKCLVPRRAYSNWGKDLMASAIGEIDTAPGVEVLGTFDGETISLVSSLQGSEFKQKADWLKLPSKLPKPRMGISGKTLHVWSEHTGQGYSVDIATKKPKAESYPPGVKWMRWSEGHMFAQKSNGEVWSDGKQIGKMRYGSPVVIGRLCLVDESGKGGAAIAFPLGDNGDWAAGDIDKDGDQDLIKFRYGAEAHSGNNVLLYRTVTPGETDSDADGLTNEQEAKLGTDPLNPDTDNDALNDGWEVGTYRDLDLKAMGCNPRKVDLICLISPFEQLKADFYNQQFDEVRKYFAGLESVNPDGSKGWNLHTIFLDPVKEADQKKSWWQLRDERRPAKWKGIVHWMQITPWGGGQADQLGDGGGCGGGGWAMFATFVHEFGHQLGLPHEGFYGAAWCPTYFSLMNYAYSYGFEDDIKKVQYSDGRLAEYTMKETNLDESIPLPYEKIKFLERGPYRYRLKANGPNATLIDWNWNGVFGEKGIRADINYSYSTGAGRRDEVDKLMSAPWLFTHQDRAYVLFAKHKFPGDVKTDPTVSFDKPGALYVRRLIKPYKWEDATIVEAEGVTGDPVAISFGDRILYVYPTKTGVTSRWFDGKKLSDAVVVDVNGKKTPSVAVFENRLVLALWDPATQRSTYQWWNGKAFGEARPFNFLSRVPVGMVEDTIRKQLVVGLTDDQDKGRTSRWQIRRYTLSGDTLFDRGREWIEGDKGGSRGSSRPVLLFDPSKDWGPEGRIYYFTLGLTSEKSPWACAYVAHTIGDKTVNGGWRVKRYYDEWTQSRSGPAVAWFGGDMIYAYRWVDGSQNDRDNLLHVAYRGSGIEDVPMGDFNDIKFMREFGIRYSILYMAE